MEVDVIAPVTAALFGWTGSSCWQRPMPAASWSCWWRPPRNWNVRPGCLAPPQARAELRGRGTPPECSMSLPGTAAASPTRCSAHLHPPTRSPRLQGHPRTRRLIKFPAARHRHDRPVVTQGPGKVVGRLV